MGADYDCEHLDRSLFETKIYPFVDQLTRRYSTHYKVNCVMASNAKAILYDAFCTQLTTLKQGMSKHNEDDKITLDCHKRGAALSLAISNTDAIIVQNGISKRTYNAWLFRYIIAVIAGLSLMQYIALSKDKRITISFPETENTSATYLHSLAKAILYNREENASLLLSHIFFDIEIYSRNIATLD